MNHSPIPKNTLHLYHGLDTESLTHAGQRINRNYSIWINGVEVEHFTEGIACNGLRGPGLFRVIANRIATYEKALGCVCSHASAKGNTTTNPPFPSSSPSARIYHDSEYATD